MPERVLMEGNEAICRGALEAGCKGFFGYPITPQNEIPEFMSRELPKVGGVFIQSECEVAAINMVYGGALSGLRVMTSTSSPGFSLMQEGISNILDREMPAVLVDVVRMGPAGGTGGQHGQTDYRQATKGTGHGGLRCIVLAPASVQEHYDLIQLAFHLADKYRILVILLSDFILGRMSEMLELRPLEFEPLPEKEWALRGKGEKGGRRDVIASASLGRVGGIQAFHQRQLEKYREIERSETRFESFHAEDARLLLVAYGSSARMAQEVVVRGRAEGLPLGLLRPISVWPFPTGVVKELALGAGRVLVVEDSPGLVLDDVEAAVQGQVPVHFHGVWARHTTGTGGLLHPETILEEARRLL